jgi:hypothetical protein
MIPTPFGGFFMSSMEDILGDLGAQAEEVHHVNALKGVIRAMCPVNGRFDDILPKILSTIANFVTDSPPYIYTRFYELAVMQIRTDSTISGSPPVWILNPSLVRPLLHMPRGGYQTEISKSYSG